MNSFTIDDEDLFAAKTVWIETNDANKALMKLKRKWSIEGKLLCGLTSANKNDFCNAFGAVSIFQFKVKCLNFDFFRHIDFFCHTNVWKKIISLYNLVFLNVLVNNTTQTIRHDNLL